MTAAPSSTGSIVRRQRPSTLIFGVSDEGVDAVAALLDPLAAAEVVELDDERALDDLGAHLLEQAQRGVRGAAGREQIVDDEDALALGDGVDVDLDLARAVLQRVLVRDRRVR